MRKVVISESVMWKLAELDAYMQQVLKLSKPAARKRTDRINAFLAALSAPVSHAVCRNRIWHKLGYQCASFGEWVFAYEVFDNGVIIHDMTHGSPIADVIL